MVLIDFLKRRKVLIIILAVLFLVLIAAVLWFALNQPAPPKKSPKRPKISKEKKPPEPVTAESPLDGIRAEPDLVNRQAIAVMVENLNSIRPQTGISQASFVVEGLSEGGITRFMVVYLEKDAENIGPVRSARIHFVELVKGLEALYAHVGGSNVALEAIKSFDVDDLDQFAYSSAYRRVPGIGAPHNVFTSTAALRAARTPGSNKPPGFSFKEDIGEGERPAEQKVSINFSFPEYAVDWIYQPLTNSYLRVNGGKPHTDAANGKQLEAKDIIIMTSPTAPVPGTSLLDIDTTGSGRVRVIRDGTVVNGTWTRPSVDDWLKLTDDNGREIELNPGQVWLEIVGPATAVTITAPPRSQSEAP